MGNVVSDGLIDVGLITENADFEVGSSNVGEFDSTGETFVFLGIVVFEHDLWEGK